MRLDHLLSKELTAHAVPYGVLGVVATAHAARVWGWLLMGGTLTKELASVALVSVPAPARAPRGCGWVWWNLTAWGCGVVEHTVGSSGHRPLRVVVPGTGRSVDHEPLTWSGAVPARVLVGATGG